MRILVLMILCFSFVCCSSSRSRVNFTDGGLSTPAETGKLYDWSFDEKSEGLPPNFFSVLGDWKVASSESFSAPNGIRQDGAYERNDYPRLIVKDLDFTNMRLSVSCKPVSGKTDQACGLIFRMKDSSNYYIVRANALENNVRFYRVVNDDRQQIASGDVVVEPGKWHSLEITVSGEETAVGFNGKEVFRARDSQFNSGKIGLWTKADSVTIFDNLAARELGK